MDIKFPSKSHVIELRNGLSPNDNECRKYKNLPHEPEYKLLINQSYSKQVKRVNKKKPVCVAFDTQTHDYFKWFTRQSSWTNKNYLTNISCARIAVGDCDVMMCNLCTVSYSRRQYHRKGFSSTCDHKNQLANGCGHMHFAFQHNAYKYVNSR